MKIIAILNFLSKHSIINILLLTGFYLLVVLPHEKVGAFIGRIFSTMPRSKYNGIMLVISIIILVVIALFFVRNVMHLRQKKKIIIYALITFLLMIISYKYLFTLNIEFIHFVQYGLFVILCFPLCKSYIITYIWASIAGFFDEMYQYLVLAPERTDYFDINDVIINMIGAGGGLVILKSLSMTHNNFDWRTYVKSVQFYFLIFLVGIFIVLKCLGYVSMNPTDKAVFVMFKTPHPEFWTQVASDITLHIVKPLEGLFLSTCLLFFYSFIEKS